jgi:hypothetical protein
VPTSRILENGLEKVAVLLDPLQRDGHVFTPHGNTRSPCTLRRGERAPREVKA